MKQLSGAVPLEMSFLGKKVLTRRSDHFKAFIITFVMRLYIFMRCTKNSVFTEYNAISQRAVWADLFLFTSQNEQCVGGRGRGGIDILVHCMMINREFSHVPVSASWASERTALKVRSVMLYSALHKYSPTLKSLSR